MTVYSKLLADGTPVPPGWDKCRKKGCKLIIPKSFKNYGCCENHSNYHMKRPASTPATDEHTAPERPKRVRRPNKKYDHLPVCPSDQQQIDKMLDAATVTATAGAATTVLEEEAGTSTAANGAAANSTLEAASATHDNAPTLAPSRRDALPAIVLLEGGACSVPGSYNFVPDPNFVATDEMPHQLHSPLLPEMPCHVQISKKKDHIPESYFRQATALALYRRFRWFLDAEETGPTEGNCHLHFYFMCRTRNHRKYEQALRNEVYALFHDEGANGTGVAIPCRAGGYVVTIKIGLNGTEHTAARVRGYLLKDPNARVNSAGEEMSERKHLVDLRDWAMCAKKRPGKPVGRGNMFDFTWRFRTVYLPALRFLPFQQSLRLGLIATADIRGKATSDLVCDGKYQNNAEAASIMWKWEFADDCDMAAAVTIPDVHHVYFRSFKSGPICDHVIDPKTLEVYGPAVASADWSTVSYAEARRLNDIVADAMGSQGDPRGSNEANYSDTPVTYDYVRHLLSQDKALRDGSQRNYPGGGRGPPPTARAAASDTTATNGMSTGMGTGMGSAQEPEPERMPFNQSYIEQCQYWLQQYDKLLFRCRFLVIAGPSMCGKSQFAKYAPGFDNPHVCASDFDMRKYDPKKHDAIILNDIRNPQKAVLEYKEFFQCNKEPTTLGGSQTSMYAFEVDTYRKPIILTTNLNDDFRKLKEDTWVQANAYCIVAKGPMFDGEIAITDADVARHQGWQAAAAVALDQLAVVRITTTQTRRITAATAVPMAQATPIARPGGPPQSRADKQEQLKIDEATAVTLQQVSRLKMP